MGRRRPIKKPQFSGMLRTERRTVSVRNICPNGTLMPQLKTEGENPESGIVNNHGTP